jgi:uncharacterized protein
MRLALALALLPLPALADVDAALSDVVLPGVAAFGEAADALAAAECGAMEAPLAQAWDAWARIGDLRLGAVEAQALTIAFWPDERGAGARALRALGGEPPADYAEMSAAARGFPALDLLLHEPDLASCDLVRAASADLAAQADALEAAWAEEAERLRDAGSPGNASYLSEEEAFRALYTALLSSLEFTADSRLGRPLGTFERPRPTRAEGWRSGHPLPGALLSAEGAFALAEALAGEDLPLSAAAMEQVRAAAANIPDPSFQDIEDPTARLRVEILQQRVRALSDAIEAEVGAPRGIAPGFNSQDGD